MTTKQEALRKAAPILAQMVLRYRAEVAAEKKAEKKAAA